LKVIPLKMLSYLLLRINTDNCQGSNDNENKVMASPEDNLLQQFEDGSFNAACQIMWKPMEDRTGAGRSEWS
jgi:hypothetical protein